MIDVNRIKGLISYMTFYVVGKNAILLFVAIFLMMVFSLMVLVIVSVNADIRYSYPLISSFSFHFREMTGK